MASIQRWHLAVYVAEATIVAGLRIEDAVGIRHVRDRGRPDGWWLLTYGTIEEDEQPAEAKDEDSLWDTDDLSLE